MANPIVSVVVSQQQAPAPNRLQKTGAIISQGGTTMPVGSSALLQQPADLNSVAVQPINLSTVVWNSAYGGQVTATSVSALPTSLPVGSKFQTTIAGVTPAIMNSETPVSAAARTAATHRRRISLLSSRRLIGMMGIASPRRLHISNPTRGACMT